MAFTGPIEDRLAIRELYGTYAGAAFASDAEAWLECWADDCTWETPVGKAVGKQQLQAQWTALMAQVETMTFATEVVAIEADGDRATGRCYSRESSLWKDGSSIRIVGRYDDEMVRVDGNWRFTSRRFSMHLADA